MTTRKQAVGLPQQRDCIGSLINPTNGYRGELTKKGITPKNHMRDNLKEIRLTEFKLRQRKEEKELSENRKTLFKLPQFQHVESRLYNQADSSRREEPDFDRENPKYLTRGVSDLRREELAREKKMVRQELESKFAHDSPYPEDSRKAPVPRANEQNLLPSHAQSNFIQRNKVNAITMQPKKGMLDDGDEIKHREYGKIPQYLEDRKAKWMEEEEERRRRLPDPNCPPGMCLMPESERNETLQVLNDSRREALEQLRKLPFVIETPSMRKKQEFLENKLKEIDHALAIFSKPKVYVAIDR